MDFNKYQALAKNTATYKEIGHPLVYPCIGLSGEAGEVAEKVKKLIRNTDGTITEAFRQDIKMELGDILWYVSELARQCNIPLGEVASANIQKLADRQERGVLNSNGDYRWTSRNCLQDSNALALTRPEIHT